MEKPTIDEMKEDLEQFYEAAGFANYRKQVIEKMTETEIVKAWSDALG